MQFPSCLVLSSFAAMLFGGHRLHLFCQFWGENCSNFAGIGDLETGTALSGFSTLHLDPQMCEGKKRGLPVTCLHAVFQAWNQIMG